MSKVYFIGHKGKEILFIDFSNCELDEIFPIIEESKTIIKSKPKNSLLTLTNISNTNFNENISDAFKEYTIHNKPYVKAGAVVGVTGLKKIVYMAVAKFSGRTLTLFDDIEQAKNWLVKQ